ncbi:cannabinoid receptor 2-like [Corythoichthys intestinalis]|uniref:cannabinoid receptor 2-like n=1 Tax=Corythoichthys intestinalis TaxID=161448 RepID=UPI0025A5712F|nr:cannabinoid receptor 2-like [Corythoichthys intestinalis]XP_057691370.1 cannabinoid receptor 2-like [Corythoichthys intestinalis]XP_057691456.1 cannabinoid receptor 2-like [Corythoichthys intestinalis]XP_057691457.1 cannabinoid receptor 2-like [Corythoichthys intestinalis]
MAEWEVPASLGPADGEENASSPIVNRSCEHLECYMVLTTAEKTAIGSICFLAGPVTLLENALILGLIAATASLRQRPSYLFIGNLALADVFASCFFTTSFLDFHLFQRSDGPIAYLFKLGGVTMAFTNSVGSLLLTALDRYLCIHRPSSYKTLLTRRRALLGLLVLWSATVFISFLPLMGWTCHSGLGSPCSRLFPYISRGYLACWTSFILVLLALILGAYVLILWKAHRHEASMCVLQGSTGAGHARMRMDIRLARTFGLILLTLVGCWLPALSFMLADVAVVLSLAQQRAFAFCSTLCLLNSAVNPLLYAMRCRELRLALLHQLKVLSQAARCKKTTTGDSDARPPSREKCTMVEMPKSSQFCSVLEQ